MRKSPTKITINCWRCKEPTTGGPNTRYCPPCRKQSAERKAERLASRLVVETRELNQKSKTMTAAEQKVIDDGWSAKHSLNLQSKIYEKGTAEWDIIAAQCTPLHRIRKQVLGERVGILADMCERTPICRHEADRELR